ncbi:unnamed protein product [Caenorhabditis auriculariae]|uniref:UDENN domain-containing protein n=1 Tax=Caenorhabditis auriculariae TaxID=2777116 RepID=A0A8S1HJ87_9PELO|nr:unnamed protein product [Caenorhabditis auriculariae]
MSAPKGFSWSRYATTAGSLFEVICEVQCPFDESLPGMVLTTFPPDYGNDPVLKSVEKFSFPCNLTENQRFSFTLTDAKSEFLFGYCTYHHSTRTTVCLISALFWPDGFFRFLTIVAPEIWAGDSSVNDVLRYAYDSINKGNSAKVVEKPMKVEFRLPNLSNRRPLFESSLRELLDLDELSVIRLYASLLKERRIIIHSESLEKSSAAVHACAAILHPMEWQSIFIPTLTNKLLDMTSAPMPFIIGLPTSSIKGVEASRFQEVVVINLDKLTVKDPFDDYQLLPNEVARYLLKELALLKRRESAEQATPITKLFLIANAMLFGNFGDGFVRDLESKTRFDVETFLQAQSAGSRNFLKEVFGSAQYLERYIDGVIDRANKNLSTEDDLQLAVPEAQVIKRDLKASLGEKVKANTNKAIGVLQSRIQKLDIAPKTQIAALKKSLARSDDGSSSLSRPSGFENVHWQDFSEPANSSTSSTPLTVGDVPVGRLVDISPASPPREIVLDAWTSQQIPLVSSRSSNANSIDQNPHRDPFSPPHLVPNKSAPQLPLWADIFASSTPAPPPAPVRAPVPPPIPSRPAHSVILGAPPPRPAHVPYSHDLLTSSNGSFGSVPSSSYSFHNHQMRPVPGTNLLPTIAPQPFERIRPSSEPKGAPTHWETFDD